jgi:transposase
MLKHSSEFAREAVRIALTRVLPRERVAVNLGSGIQAGQVAGIESADRFDLRPQADLARQKAFALRTACLSSEHSSQLAA